MQISNALDFGKRLVTQINEDEVLDLAAGLAYRFLFAIFPFAIFLAALAAFVAPALGLGDPSNDIMGALADNLPPDVAAQIRPQLEAVLDTTRPGLLSIGAITALWAATGGIAAVIKGMNKACDVEETRGFIARTGIALGLTVLGSIGIIAAFVTIVGGSVITETAVAGLGIDGSVWTAVTWLRFPVVLALVTVAVAILFKFGPNVRVSFRWALAGGAVFAVTWLLGTVAFGIYVANFANYSNTYGALGGVVILMLWFYLTGLMLLVAAEVTAMLAKGHEPELIEARRQEIRGAGAERKEAGRDGGQPVGIAAAAAAPMDDDGRTERKSGRAGDERPVVPGTEREPERSGDGPGTRQSGLAAGPDARRGPAWPVALAVVALGALAGGILGRIAGEDEAGVR